MYWAAVMHMSGSGLMWQLQILARCTLSAGRPFVTAAPVTQITS